MKLQRTWLTAGIVLALLGATMPIQAANCPGPDTFGHQCADNPTLCALENPATPIAIADESCVVRPIGFSFVLYGTTFTDVGVHDNGFVELGGCFTASAFQNACPQPEPRAPNNAIYGVWDDLDPGAGGAVLDGLTGVAPNQVYTVAWVGVPEFGQPTSVSVEIQMHENGGAPNEGLVRIFISNADSADYTSGIENATGTDSLTRYCDNGATGTPICTEYFFPTGPADPAIVALESKMDLAESKLDSLESKLDLLDLSGITAIEGKLDTSLDAAVSTRASQASVDAMEAKVDLLDTSGVAAIEGKLDTSLDAAVSTRATQASVDAIETKADALEAKVDLLDTSGIAAIEGKLDAGLDAAVSTRATQASVDALEVKVDLIDPAAIAAIEGKLDTNLDAAVSTRATQASVDAIETKADVLEAKVDLLDTSGIAAIEGKLDVGLDAAVSTRATQASVDAIETKADALEGKLDANLDAAVSTRASQASVDAMEAKVDLLDTSGIAAIEGKLDTSLDAAISTRASQLSVDAIEAKVDLLNTGGIAAIEGKLDSSLDAAISTRASQASVDGIETKADAMEVKLDAIQAAVGGGGTGPVSIADQLQLEQLLCELDCTPDMMLPNAFGGILEDVRDWVLQQINATEAAGDPNLAPAVPSARFWWDRGVVQMNNGQYSEACRSFASGMQRICRMTP